MTQRAGGEGTPCIDLPQNAQKRAPVRGPFPITSKRLTASAISPAALPRLRHPEGLAHLREALLQAVHFLVGEELAAEAAFSRFDRRKPFALGSARNFDVNHAVVPFVAMADVAGPGVAGRAAKRKPLALNGRWHGPG